MLYNLKYHRVLNNIFFVVLFLILIFALLVYFDILPKDYLFFQMEYFGKFYRRAFNYILIGCIAIFFARKKIKNNQHAEIILSLIFLNFFTDAMGNLMGWFSVGNPYSIVWYDNYAHILGGLIYTLVFYLIYLNFFSKCSRVLIAIAAMGTSYTIATLFGVSEYLSDIYASTYMVGGLEDAMSDNIWDFLGVMIACVGIGLYLLIRKRKVSLKNNILHVSQRSEN